MKITLKTILPALIILFISELSHADVISVVSNDTNAIDAFLQQNEANTPHSFASPGDHGTNAVIEVDQKIAGRNSQAHGMLAFTDFIGNNPGQIPLGSTVDSAELSVWLVNDNKNNPVSIFRLTDSWDETVTWNSFGGGIIPGVNADASSEVIAHFGRRDPVTVTVDITDIVNDWVSGGMDNNGIGFVNSHRNNGLQFAAVENTSGSAGWHTPILNVSYTSPVPEPTTIVMLAAGGLLVILKKRRIKRNPKNTRRIFPTISHNHIKPMP